MGVASSVSMNQKQICVALLGFISFFFSPQSTVQILSSIRMVVQKAGSEAENGPNEGDTSHVWNWAAIPVLRFLS